MSSVHYKGAAPATIDVLAGQVPVLFENILTNKSLQTPDMRERLRLLGATPGSGTPEQFAALFRDEVAKWSKVVKSAGVRVD